MLTNEDGQVPKANINTSSTNQGVMPMAPIGKPGSIVTYSPRKAVFKTNSAARYAISTAVGIGFGIAWAAHGGRIVIGSTTASNAKWNIVKSVAIGNLVNAVAMKPFNKTKYTKVHQYASWSDYYNTYLLNDVITRYDGHTTSTGKHMYGKPLEVEIRRTTYYGSRAKLRR